MSCQEGLRIERAEFHQFRNYGSFNLEGLGNLTLIVGRNAIGKTNILEGLQLLTSAHSFRNPKVAELLHEGCENGRISLSAGDGNRKVDIGLFLEKGKKRYEVNGKVKSAADVRGLLPSVMFTPDDLQLVKKSSSVKRDALDNLGMQLTRSYYTVRKDYEKTIKYKNRLLKDDAPDVLVESINETLVMCGAQLFCLRRALFERMLPVVREVYFRLSGGGEEFSASYRPSWDRLSGESYATPTLSRDEAREVLAEKLTVWHAEEVRRGRSLVGPHNDEISFSLGDRVASAFASQGQQRSIVLAWKIAEVRTVRDVLGMQPVLLLDDVLSELDATRREMLVQFVTDDIQTFITGTDLDGFAPELLEKAHIIHLPLEEEGNYVVQPVANGLNQEVFSSI